MKRLYHFILLVSIAVITFNCQKEISYSGPDIPGTGNNNTDPITATLQGNIVDENGQPAIGVTIKVGTKTATTNARGYFRIVNASLDKKTSLLTAEKAGYFKAFRIFSATSGVNQVAIQLVKKTSAGSVNAGSGGAVTLSNGSKITLPANGVVRATGGTYTGNINVYASYIDPTSTNIAETVPGSFLAIDKDDKKVVLTSYGMLAVELESSSGEKLQMANGSMATLTTAIPSSLQSSAPASISLWYVDEQTGIWKEEGTATKTGTTYVGEVKHFSYWNCDVPGPTVNLSATFVNTAGLPLVHTEIRIRPASGYASAHGLTDSLGQVSDPVPANMNLILEVLSSCYTVMYSQNIGPFSSDANLGTITVNNNPSIVTVSGRLLSCSGAPVTNGFAVINYDNVIRYANVVGANGEFATTFSTCGGMAASCEIYGIDAAAQQQGAMVNVTVVSPITNAGNITACGTSALQYINYNLDGVNQSFSSLTAGDQFSASSVDTAGSSFGAYIMGYNSANQGITFQFNNNGTAGIYQVGYLGFHGSNSPLTLLQPFNVTVTQYPQVTGQYFEGSFSGQYTDVAGFTHNISCSFRVRRL
ncbi:MAG TPA: carboxypeptidase-like regulatory domain-containing protein [Chitinophagaceae bacterium]